MEQSLGVLAVLEKLALERRQLLLILPPGCGQAGLFVAEALRFRGGCSPLGFPFALEVGQGLREPGRLLAMPAMLDPQAGELLFRVALT